MADDSKISPYNVSDCKNTTDDALQNYLGSLKITQTHFYTDVKLALGWSAVIISAACFAWDYKLGFEDTKYWTAAAVAVYFLLNGAFTGWMWFIEKDVVFTGTWQGRQLIISTKTKKMDPNYNIKARYSASTSPNELKEVSITAPFMQWFTADGYFVAKPFQQWLASSVPLVGEADLQNKAAGAISATPAEQPVDASSLNAALDSFATGSKAATGGKRRKG